MRKVPREGRTGLRFALHHVACEPGATAVSALTGLQADISSEVETMTPRFAGQTRELAGAPVGLTPRETSVAQEDLALTRQIEVGTVPDISHRMQPVWVGRQSLSGKHRLHGRILTLRARAPRPFLRARSPKQFGRPWRFDHPITPAHGHIQRGQPFVILEVHVGTELDQQGKQLLILADDRQEDGGLPLVQSEKIAGHPRIHVGPGIDDAS